MLFEPQSEQAIREAAKRAKADARKAMRSRFNLAIDYLDGKQENDVKSELEHRFPSSMSGDSGQQIFPVTVPLVERFIAESANAYNRPVRRYFTDENGEENDATREQTDKLNRALARAKYDDIMHRNEQLSVLLGSSVVWHQAKRGQLRPTIIYPQDVYPILPDGPQFVDAADPNDYDGFAVELFYASEDGSKTQKRTFALVTAAQTSFYTGSDPYKPDEILSTHENPFQWMQVRDDRDDDAGLVSFTEAMLPLCPLTFWNRVLPINELIPDTDVDIVSANREINVMMSVLFDNIRFQGHAVPVKKLANPGDPKAIQRHGVRFPAVMGIEESFELVSAATSYTEQVQVLKDFARMVAISKRMSPNDFSIDGAPATSGFAKMVDSLPKLEARDERIRRLTHQEEQVAAPRNISILIHLGHLDEVARSMQLRVRFADVEFPRTEDEKTAAMERELKYNLTTPAKILAHREGISEDEAQARIDANKASNGSSGESEQEEREENQRGLFGTRIGRPSRNG